MYRLCKGTRVSHNTVLVVECDGPIATERISRAVARLLDSCPWPASRLRRTLPWGALCWAAGPRAALAAPPVRRRSVRSAEELHAELETELDSSIDPRRESPLRFLVLDGPDEREGSVLVLTWFHPFMDPRGAQSLLRHLLDLDEEDLGRSRNGVRASAAMARDPRPLRERARLGRRSLEYMRGLTPVPPVSPGTGLTTPGRARFWQGSFAKRDSSRADERRTRDICWRLALVGNAMSRLWEKRGLPDVPYLVPVSVDLRPKGDTGAAIGNWLAFHFARFKPSEADDVPALARSLRAQMTEALRAGEVDANAVAMEFLRYRPLWMMPRSLPGGPGGGTFSFNCADIRDFPLRTVFGRRVLNAYHAPAILPQPGIGVFFNRYASRDNLVISWVEGAVSEDEVASVADVVVEGMGWTAAP